MENHPEGILLSKLAVFYSQKYHHNLTVSDAGFSSIAEFVAALTEHLVVKNGTVFHRKHIPQTQDTEEEVEEVAESCPEGILFFLQTGKKSPASTINVI